MFPGEDKQTGKKNEGLPFGIFAANDRNGRRLSNNNVSIKQKRQDGGGGDTASGENEEFDKFMENMEKEFNTTWSKFMNQYAGEDETKKRRKRRKRNEDEEEYDGGQLQETFDEYTRLWDEGEKRKKRETKTLYQVRDGNRLGLGGGTGGVTHTLGRQVTRVTNDNRGESNYETFAEVFKHQVEADFQQFLLDIAEYERRKRETDKDVDVEDLFNVWKEDMKRRVHKRYDDYLRTRRNDETRGFGDGFMNLFQNQNSRDESSVVTKEEDC